MFGSLGVPELLLIFAVILIVFGPRRIPEIGRTLGKAMGEFRKATDDLKSTIEREVRLEELKSISMPNLESFTTPEESVSRSGPERQIVDSAGQPVKPPPPPSPSSDLVPSSDLTNGPEVLEPASTDGPAAPSPVDPTTPAGPAGRG